MAKSRIVYVQNGSAENRPSVRISKTSDGIMFAVHATGRSLNLARVRAEKAYKALMAFCRDMEKGQ